MNPIYDNGGSGDLHWGNSNITNGGIGSGRYSGPGADRK